MFHYISIKAKSIYLRFHLAGKMIKWRMHRPSKCMNKLELLPINYFFWEMQNL